MKRALVTGAGKRLGRAMAIELAGQGYDVAVHYATSRQDADDVAAEIIAKGQNAAVLQADLLVEAEVATLVTDAAAALGGPITVLVNNASIFEHDTLETATRESWDRHVESNLRAPVVLTQAMAAQVPAAALDVQNEPLARGLVVNMIDQRVHNLTPHFMSYTIAKMGLWAFTRTAAQALAPHVRVNGIGPGPTLQASDQTEAAFAAERAATILGRGANLDDITGALRYLLHAPAVTGQMLTIDGGQHLQWLREGMTVPE